MELLVPQGFAFPFFASRGQSEENAKRQGRRRSRRGQKGYLSGCTSGRFVFFAPFAYSRSLRKTNCPCPSGKETDALPANAWGDSISSGKAPSHAPYLLLPAGSCRD